MREKDHALCVFLMTSLQPLSALEDTHRACSMHRDQMNIRYVLCICLAATARFMYVA